MPKVKQKTLHVDEPKPKFVWESSKEESLWEIVEHGENGRLKKKIVNQDSNIKLKLEVPWGNFKGLVLERVAESRTAHLQWMIFVWHLIYDVKITS